MSETFDTSIAQSIRHNAIVKRLHRYYDKIDPYYDPYLYQELHEMKITDMSRIIIIEQAPWPWNERPSGQPLAEAIIEPGVDKGALFESAILALDVIHKLNIVHRSIDTSCLRVRNGKVEISGFHQAIDSRDRYAARRDVIMLAEVFLHICGTKYTSEDAPWMIVLLAMKDRRINLKTAIHMLDIEPIAEFNVRKCSVRIGKFTVIENFELIAKINISTSCKLTITGNLIIPTNLELPVACEIVDYSAYLYWMNLEGRTCYICKHYAPPGYYIRLSEYRTIDKQPIKTKDVDPTIIAYTILYEEALKIYITQALVYDRRPDIVQHFALLNTDWKSPADMEEAFCKMLMGHKPTITFANIPKP